MKIAGAAFVKKFSIMTVSVALMGGLSACSTTNIVKTSQAAPVTYKVGQKGMQYASVAMPKRPKAITAQPQFTSQPRFAAPQVEKFNAKKVDRDLYAHQRVGKRYKVNGKSYTPKHEPSYDKKGQASWYGPGFHGKPTASGEIFDKNDLTAAHKTLPLNSMAFVTNLENGKTLMVRINDRGPFVAGRIIDLSEASARALGYIDDGLGRVRVQYAGPADPMAATNMYKGKPQRSAPMVAEAQPVLPTPAPQAPSYTPLRELPRGFTPQVAAPVMPLPQPQWTAPAPVMPAPVVPQAPTPVAPEAEGEDGGIVTLTIKGPVHVASSRAADTQPRFIPAVNHRTYKTN